MTVLRDISYLWSMLHVVALFLLLFEPRYSWRATLWAGFAGAGTLLAVNVLAMFWLGHGIIMAISFFTCTLPTLLLFFILAKYRDGRFFFLFCLTDTTCFWLLQLTNFLDRLTGDTYITLLIGRLLVFPLVEYLFWRYLRRPYLELQSRLNSGWWLFAAVGATYYLLIMFTAVPVDAPLPDMAGLARILLVMLLMPLTYLTVMRSLWRQMQIFRNQQQLERQRLNYQAICQKVELGRMYRHDTRHHLIILETMLKNGDELEALQYIQNLGGRLARFSERVWCDNPAVNAVLDAYIAQAEEAGCRLDTYVNIPAELPYDEMHLCIILANTLENAVNACRGLNEDERWLKLRLELTPNQRFKLALSNASGRQVPLGKDGLPAGQRQDGHGLGLRSVQTIVEHYGGLLDCQSDEHTFTLRLALFPPAVAQE